MPSIFRLSPGEIYQNTVFLWPRIVLYKYKVQDSVRIRETPPAYSGTFYELSKLLKKYFFATIFPSILWNRAE